MYRYVRKTFKSCYGQQEIIVHANFSSPEPNAYRETSVTLLHVTSIWSFYIKEKVSQCVSHSIYLARKLQKLSIVKS